MSARDELQRLAGVLSERECAELLRAVADVAAGERFWEDDLAICYNEYIKHRSYGPRASRPDPAGETGADIFAPIPLTTPYGPGTRTRLPKPPRVSASFSSVVLRRRSRREFGGPLDLGRLSALLQHGCGVTGSIAAYGYDRVPLRTFPSAGALQAPEVYLVAQAVDRLAPGVYRYHPLDHALERLEHARAGALDAALIAGHDCARNAAAICIISGRYERLRWKYGPRAYRLMCLEAGCLAENLCLAAEALGLGACALDGFVDTAVEQLIGADGSDEIALLLLAVGALPD